MISHSVGHGLVIEVSFGKQSHHDAEASFSGDRALWLKLFARSENKENELVAEKKIAWPESQLPYELQVQDDDKVELLGKEIKMLIPFKRPSLLVHRIGCYKNVTPVKVCSWTCDAPMDESWPEVWKSVGKICGKQYCKQLQTTSGDNPIFSQEQQLEIISKATESHKTHLHVLVTSGIFTSGVGHKLIELLFSLEMPETVLEFLNSRMDLSEPTLVAILKNSLSRLSSDDSWRAVITAVLGHSFSPELILPELGVFTCAESLLLLDILHDQLSASGDVQKTFEWFLVFLDAQHPTLILDDGVGDRLRRVQQLVCDTLTLVRNHDNLMQAIKKTEPPPQTANLDDYVVESLVF